MTIHTISSYRLKSKAVSTNKTFTAENGIIFSIFESIDSKSFAHYYIVETKCEKEYNCKITPLAHLHISKNTGNVKIESFQPEIWNLKTSCEDFVENIRNAIPGMCNAKEKIIAC
ncbi:hypothetical protein [Plesiomonas shigelloides]|uniref:hypothetical protein n=1 Tax=Plesiomonas shigelloides TaxID=703 RepID=UPI001181B89C|nr:hypothetical protein [Plesiomonas shigelloides]